MAAKHNLKARRGVVSEASHSVLRKIKVPIRESWATLYLELQSRNAQVLINARRRIFVADSLIGSNPEPTGAATKILRRKLTLRSRNLVAAGSATATCLIIGLSLFGQYDLKPGNENPPTPQALTMQTNASMKCVIDEARAASKALSTDTWQKLGGVGYAVVTIKCNAKSRNFRVVKNLVTGEIASVKSVG